MRAPWFLRVLAVATAVAVWSPDFADAQCPGGRFVARDAIDPDAEPVLVVIDTDRKPSALTGCGIVKPQRGTKKWPLRAKLGDCATRPKKRRLLGRWSLDCAEVSLQVRGKRLRRALLAAPSACGDGLVDAQRGEQCESSADCGLGGQCYEQCRCEPPPTTTTLLSTSTTSTTVTGGTTTTTFAPIVPLGPGDVAEVTTFALQEVHQFGIVLDEAAPVLVRAAEITASHGPPCVRPYDTAGEPVSPSECSDIKLPVPRDYAAGEYVLRAVWTRTGTYVLQYLPLALGLTPALPVGFDPFIDDALPSPGLLRAYSFTLDAPRRVFVRLDDLNLPPVFQPCMQVFAAGVDFGDAPSRCAEAPILDLALGAGTHFVVVSDKFHDSGGSYRLQVMQLAPAFAHELTGTMDCRTLGDPNDLDVYKFTVTAPATPVSLVLAEFGTNADDFKPCLRLWDGENGDVLSGEPECSGTGEIDQTLDAGTYYVTIHDDFRTAAGGYCLTRQ